MLDFLLAAEFWGGWKARCLTPPLSKPKMISSATLTGSLLRTCNPIFQDQVLHIQSGGLCTPCLGPLSK